ELRQSECATLGAVGAEQLLNVGSVLGREDRPASAEHPERPRNRPQNPGWIEFREWVGAAGGAIGDPRFLIVGAARFVAEYRFGGTIGRRQRQFRFGAGEEGTLDVRCHLAGAAG